MSRQLHTANPPLINSPHFGTHPALTVAYLQPREDAMCHDFNPLEQFQSYQYLYLAPDEIVLSFKDSAAMEALYTFAD